MQAEKRNHNLFLLMNFGDDTYQSMKHRPLAEVREADPQLRTDTCETVDHASSIALLDDEIILPLFRAALEFCTSKTHYFTQIIYDLSLLITSCFLWPGI